MSTLEKEKPNHPYHGGLIYHGEFEKEALTLLAFYLQGHPDTPHWRDTIIFNQTEIVEYGDKIYPQWAVLDAHQLLQEKSQIFRRFLRKSKLSLKDIPPLPEGLDNTELP